MWNDMEITLLNRASSYLVYGLWYSQLNDHDQNDILTLAEHIPPEPIPYVDSESEVRIPMFYWHTFQWLTPILDWPAFYYNPIFDGMAG
jgi:hypothetical protein